MKTRFTSASGVRIAYQTLGGGDLDVVLVPGMASHVELHWCEPNYARFMRDLAGLGRLIAFDKRGTGRSDRVAGVPTLEDRMRDLVAVLDAAGCERAVIVGVSEGAALAALMAATYPARARGLILCSSFPTGSKAGTYLGAVREEQMEHALDVWNRWGSGRSYEIYAPGLVGNAIHRHLLGVFERAAASPKMMAGLVDALFEIDVRHVLPLVQVPAVMFHRKAEIAPVESARQMAELMPNCRFVELEGDDHVPFAGPGAPVIKREIERFVSDLRSERFDRAVGTVLFTDIVGSTEMAAKLGDREWLQLLDRHDDVVRESLREYGGRELKTIGDGFLAHFDGPARAVRSAATITDRVRPLDLKVRAGIHTGELELTESEARGLAVHVGARVAATAGPDEVRVSAAVKDLAVGSGIDFVPRERRQLKGLPGEWELFAVDRSSALRPVQVPATEAWFDRLSVADRIEGWWARHFPGSVRAAMRMSQGRGRGRLRDAEPGSARAQPAAGE
jgi:pimeloyl-ACP methyl ester carboxylesterase/class 3 adenylate cyclase